MKPTNNAQPGTVVEHSEALLALATVRARAQAQAVRVTSLVMSVLVLGALVTVTFVGIWYKFFWAGWVMAR